MDATGEQGSKEWLYQRCGNVTASRFKDVMAKLKNGAPGKAREDYLLEVVTERLTGEPVRHYASEAMAWGTEQETFSRMEYETRHGVIVEEVSYFPHPTLAGVGGSVDGLIGEDGIWESKSPFNTANHLRTILGGMPEEHIPQVQGYLWLTGRKWCDFTSYDPRLPNPMDLYVQRIERDDKYIAALEAEIKAFLADVETTIRRLAGAATIDAPMGGRA